MHGLINRAVQCFLRDLYGPGLWVRVAERARLPFDGFEPMLLYDRAHTEAVVAAAAAVLDRPRDALLEDLGTYLVSHPSTAALRRLLRFGGATFEDFIDRVEELPGRGRLADPDLELPELTLVERGPQLLALRCRFPLPGAGHVILGLLRALADDYGALVLLEHEGTDAEGVETVRIHLLDSGFAEGRRFELAQPVGA
jgi:hypothetical protein